MPETIGMGGGLDEGELLGFEVEPPSGEVPKPLGTDGETGTVSQDEGTAPEKDQKEASETASESEAPGKATEEQAKAAGESETTETAAETATEEVVPEEQKGRTGPIDVFGKNYPDIQSAFHALKSQYGQHRQWQEKYQELETKFADLQETLEKRTPEGDGASAPPPVAPTAGTPAKDEPRKFTDTVDWAFVDKLSNDPEHGPGKAVQFALSDVDDYVQGRIEEALGKFKPEMEERLGPVDELVQTNQEVQEAYQAFSALQSRTNEDGTSTYPELDDKTGDPEFIGRVLTRWKNNESLRSQGEYGAYLAYLDEERWNKHLGASLPDPTDAVEKRLESQNNQDAASVTESGGSTPLPPGTKRRSFASDFKKSLYEEGEDTKDAEILGF